MKSNYPHPIIAQEGWPFLSLAVFISLASHFYVGGFLPWLCWFITLFMLQFFRDPPRELPDQANALLSPADGKIVCIEKTTDPYLQREALKISVFMNVFNVHSNRSPVAGVVKQRWYFPGKFFNAALDKASLENERNALWIKTASGQDITCVQIAGLIARRILCYVDVGSPLQPGERYGFIRFGSRVDVYLPLTATVQAKLGDKVHATETILATLN